MGEWSKKIGEVGEKIVGEFLTMIGWHEAQKGIDMPCISGHKHGEPGKIRKTHGIDYFFSTKNVLINKTLDHLIISSKFTAEPYPKSPSTQFKSYFNDLASSIECFKKSELRQSKNKSFTGIENAREIGVLFWLTNSKESYFDLTEKVANCKSLSEFNYGTIYLIDNRKVEFVYNTMQILQSKYRDATIEFFYPNTGLNFDQSSRKTSGSILPIEHLISGVILNKISKEKNTTFSISCIEKFSLNRLKKLISLAQEITSSLTGDVLIIFHDYNELNHSNIVKEAKQSFLESNFTEKVSVIGKNDFTGLANE